MNFQKLKLYYMREHSKEIRLWQGHTSTVEEDPAVLKSSLHTKTDALGRSLLVAFCRNRQRCLQQAWQIWTSKCGTQDAPLHDYNYDLRAILSRPVSLSENRSELEIEVMYKWAMQKRALDPSGIANILITCKSKTAVVAVLNEIRLEIVLPGDVVIVQDTLGRPEDGIFTILSGKFDIVQFQPESRALLLLLEYYHNHDWDAARELLLKSKPFTTLSDLSGFGEGATLTNSKRGASVLVSPSMEVPAELLVVPRASFLGCVHSSGHNSMIDFEAVEFLRTTGLVKHLNVSEVVRISEDLEKVVFDHAEVIYGRGQDTKAVYILVIGDVLLINDHRSAPLRVWNDQSVSEMVQHVNPNDCYIITPFGLLGNESLVGKDRRVESTAIVVSETAVLYKVTGAGMAFIMERLTIDRYSSLAYRDIGRWEPKINEIEDMSMQNFFNTLQHAISRRDAFRGIRAPFSDTQTVNTHHNRSKRAKKDEKARKHVAGAKSLNSESYIQSPIKLSIVARHKLKEITHSVKFLDSGHVARAAIREQIFDDEVANRSSATSGSEAIFANKKISNISEMFTRAMSELSDRQAKQLEVESAAVELQLSVKMDHMGLLAGAAAEHTEIPVESLQQNCDPINDRNDKSIVVGDLLNDFDDLSLPKIDRFIRYLKALKHKFMMETGHDRAHTHAASSADHHKEEHHYPHGDHLHPQHHAHDSFHETAVEHLQHEYLYHGGHHAHVRHGVSKFRRAAAPGHSFKKSMLFSHSMKGPDVKTDNSQVQEKTSAIDMKVQIEDDKSLRVFMEDMSDESIKIRKKYMSTYLWNTRFVRVTAERPKASSAQTMLIGPPEKSQKKKKKVQLKETSKDNIEIPADNIDITLRSDSDEKLSDSTPTNAECSDQPLESSKNDDKSEKEVLEDGEADAEEDEDDEDDEDDDEEDEENEEETEEDTNDVDDDKNDVEETAIGKIIDNTKNGMIIEAENGEIKFEEKNDHLQTQNHNSPLGGNSVNNKAEGAASSVEVESKPTSAGHSKRKSVFKVKNLTDEDYRNAGVKTLQKFEETIQAEVTSSRYLDGKIRAITNSRFALGKQRDELTELFRINGKNSDINEIDDILSWREFSMQTARKLQDADKKSLPTVNVPRIRLKGCVREVSVRTKRQSGGKFGSNTLLISPGAQDEFFRSLKPSSYLEVFKKSQTKSL